MASIMDDLNAFSSLTIASNSIRSRCHGHTGHIRCRQRFYQGSESTCDKCGKTVCSLHADVSKHECSKDMMFIEIDDLTEKSIFQPPHTFPDQIMSITDPEPESKIEPFENTRPYDPVLLTAGQYGNCY